MQCINICVTNIVLLFSGTIQPLLIWFVDYRFLPLDPHAPRRVRPPGGGDTASRGEGIRDPVPPRKTHEDRYRQGFTVHIVYDNENLELNLLS